MENFQIPERVLNEKSFSGTYLLLNKINESLFNTVFKAKDKISHQDVAVKFSHSPSNLDRVGDMTRIAKFENECQITSRLSHPNIIRFLNRSDTSSAPRYIVFEYINGISLDEHLKSQGNLDAELTIVIMSQILDALIYIHDCGIIHCDIKPSNIILSERAGKPHAVLVDFGISIISPVLCTKEILHRSALSQERSGTPGYCSPEQLRGENITYRSDLYMWGLVFLECLTGMPAITGSTLAQLYHRSLSAEPVPIPVALLSHPLGYLLQKVLQKKPADRTANAALLFNELEKIAIDDLTGKPPRKILPHEDKPTIDLCQFKRDG